MVYALAPEPAGRIRKNAAGSRMRKHVLGEQAEWLDRLIAGLEAEAQDERGRRRQVAVGRELAPVGDGDAETFVLVPEAKLGIEHLPGEQVAPDGAERLPVLV